MGTTLCVVLVAIGADRSAIGTKVSSRKVVLRAAGKETAHASPFGSSEKHSGTQALHLSAHREYFCMHS